MNYDESIAYSTLALSDSAIPSIVTLVLSDTINNCIVYAVIHHITSKTACYFRAFSNKDTRSIRFGISKLRPEYFRLADKKVHDV